MTRNTIFNINALSRLLRLRVLTDSERERIAALASRRKRVPSVNDYDGPMLTNIEYRDLTNTLRMG